VNGTGRIEGNVKKKPKVRWGALTGILTSLAGIAVTLANDPHVITTVAGKLGVSAVLLGTVIAGVTKAVVRKEHERRPNLQAREPDYPYRFPK